MKNKVMKRSIFIIFAILCLFSCSSDNDNTISEEDLYLYTGDGVYKYVGDPYSIDLYCSYLLGNPHISIYDNSGLIFERTGRSIIETNNRYSLIYDFTGLDFELPIIDISPRKSFKVVVTENLIGIDLPNDVLFKFEPNK